MRKLLIVPWFGPLPEWYAHWGANVKRLTRDHGYTIMVDHDLLWFKRRCSTLLGVKCSVVPGEGKVHDYRAAFGVLYADEIRGYDFWGHTDLDVVYGRVENWVTDEFLDGLDVHSNHVDYICGPWSLYRNTPAVNELFMRSPMWRDFLKAPDVNGWVEKEFTHLVDDAHEAGEIRLRYTTWQTANLDSFDRCRLLQDGRLIEGTTERMMLHFRRTKVYPPGCIL